MKLRIAGIIEDSIVDGPGLRTTVFAQGCPHACPGCHNPKTWDAAGGSDIEVSAILDKLRRNRLVQGLTLSGGEPFLQSAAMAELARGARDMGLHIMVYSGDTFETLWARAQREEAVYALLASCDVLVDGRFVLAEKSLLLPWRGSKNQRLIDLPQSLRSGDAVAWSGRLHVA